MVEITCNKEEGLLYLKIGGDNFQDLVETLKMCHCRWNNTVKRWQVSIAKYEDVTKEILYCNGNEEYIEISEYTKEQINEYFAEMRELKNPNIRCIYHPEIMHYNPLPGKPPYENYQMVDFLQALNRNRYLFAWEMGLGKSWALTALIEHLRFYDRLDKCIIFSSPIGVWNVKAELIKFGKNQKDDEIVVFTSISDIKNYEDRDIFNTTKYPYRTIIMTYDCMKAISNYYYDSAKGTKKNPKPSQKVNYRDSYLPLEEWSEGKPMGIFLDECHLLGNPSSRRSEIMMMNMKFFEYRYLFTGTFADVYQKLYNPCKILDRWLVKGMGYTDWLTTYNEVGNRFSRYGINKDGWDLEKIDELNGQLVSSYGCKRAKRDCLDLPENYDVPTIWIDMSPKQRAIYEKFSNESASIFQAEADSKGISYSDKMKNMFSFFQLAVDNPETIRSSAKFDKFTPELQQMINDFSYDKDYNKLKCVDAILEERLDEENEPGIIWCYHPKTVESLAKRYSKYKPIVISADIDRDTRFKMIDEFKKNLPNKDSSKIIIASITLLNTSVTITECKWQVYVEKTYNYTDFIQSKNRIWRPGQDVITRNYYICYNGTIDQLQEQNLRTKGNTLDRLLTAKYISANVWSKIFKGEMI